jgi:Na+-translocating ferredoxin:NAD+ oxidoreductase subunit B
MKLIEHRGVIKSVSDDIIKVEIINHSACAQCHARMMCGVSDQKSKEIEIQTPSNSFFSEGEEVNVILCRSLGMTAVLISYVIPLIILLILLLTLSPVLKNELYCALISLAGIALYYFGVYLFRKKIKKRFVFTIEKI